MYWQREQSARKRRFVDGPRRFLYDELVGRLAQLVRAPALQAGGRRFEPCTAHHSKGEKKLELVQKEEVSGDGSCQSVQKVGDVVQLVRTLPCHGRGRGFESRRPRHSFQALAESRQFSSWSNLVHLGQCLSLAKHSIHEFALRLPLLLQPRIRSSGTRPAGKPAKVYRER